MHAEKEQNMLSKKVILKSNIATKCIYQFSINLELVASSFIYADYNVLIRSQNIEETVSIKPFRYFLKYKANVSGYFALIQYVTKFLPASFQNRIYEHTENQTQLRMKRIFYEKEQHQSKKNI